jgi:hypothetical protein
MSTHIYLKTFLTEKEIPFRIFEIKDNEGTTHFVDTDVIKESILNTGISEKLVIANTLKKIDHYNASVTDYFQFLAKALVVNYGKVL